MFDRLGWPPRDRILKGARLPVRVPRAAWRRHISPGSALSLRGRRWGAAPTSGKYVAVNAGYGGFLDLTPELRPSGDNNRFAFVPP